jgi:hypothetical protein
MQRQQAKKRVSTLQHHVAAASTLNKMQASSFGRCNTCNLAGLPQCGSTTDIAINSIFRKKTVQLLAGLLQLLCSVQAAQQAQDTMN